MNEIFDIKAFIQKKSKYFLSSLILQIFEEFHFLLVKREDNY